MSVDLSPPMETTEGKNVLSPKQRQVAILIAQGYSQEKAVREVGMSIRTFQRWHKQPAFNEALETLKKNSSISTYAALLQCFLKSPWHTTSFFVVSRKRSRCVPLIPPIRIIPAASANKTRRQKLRN